MVCKSFAIFCFVIALFSASLADKSNQREEVELTDIVSSTDFENKTFVGRKYEDNTNQHLLSMACYCRSIESVYATGPLPCDTIKDYYNRGDNDGIHNLLKSRGVPYGHGTKDYLASLLVHCQAQYYGY